MVDFFLGWVWSRTFGSALLAQALAALVGMVFCWRAALAFNRPAPWWWVGLLFLLLAGRPIILLGQDLFPSDARWVPVLDVLVMPSLLVGVMAMVLRAVSTELAWHHAQQRDMSENIVQLRRMVAPSAAGPPPPPSDPSSPEYVERYVVQLEGLVKLWANDARVGVISIGEDSVIRYANPGAHFLFGYPWGGLLGRPLTDLMPPALRPRHLAAIRRYLETGQQTVSWRNLLFDALCEDGTTRPITLTFIEHRLVDDRVFTGVMQERRTP